jgi:hypothetical protein
MTPRLLRLLASPRWPLFAALLGVLLMLGSLGGGIGGDDLLHRAWLDGYPRDPRVLFALFVFFPGDAAGNEALAASGVLPWWHAPDLRLVFFRPLSAGLHWIDYRVFGHAWPLHHVHSLAWYALAVWLAARLYRRISPSAVAAGLAALMFAAEDAHAMPAAWLANRNALVSLCFGLLALWLHVRSRTEGPRWLLAPAVGALGLGLLAGEAALATGCYLLAWEFCLARGSRAGRLAALLPYGLVLLPWRLVTEALGFGARGSGLYLDPGHDPAGFLSAFLERFPSFFLAQWFQVPMDGWLTAPRLVQGGIALAGGVAMLVVVALVRDLLRDRAEARFWALGMLLSLVLCCASFPMDRQLLFVGLGAFGLLAEQAEYVGRLRDPLPTNPPRARWRLTRLLLALHVNAVLVITPLRVILVPGTFDLFRNIVREAPADEALQGQTLVFVNGIDLLAAYVQGARQAEGGTVPRRVALLSSMLAGAELVRDDDRTLRIRPEGGFLAHPADRFTRSVSRAFAVGERLRTEDFEVEILEVSSDGRPAEARFVFDVPLEDPSLRWVHWKEHVLQPFLLPDVGGHVSLARSLPGLGDAFGRDAHSSGGASQGEIR